MAQEFDRELARLWRVHRTIQEMISDRVCLMTNFRCAATDEVGVHGG
jgi:hypothetical protein